MCSSNSRVCLKSSNFAAGVFLLWSLKRCGFRRYIHENSNKHDIFQRYRAAHPIWSLAYSLVAAVLILVASPCELGILSWGSSLVFIEQIQLSAYLLRPLHCPKERLTTPQHLPHFSQESSAPGGWSVQWMEVGPK